MALDTTNTKNNSTTANTNYTQLDEALYKENHTSNN